MPSINLAENPLRMTNHVRMDEKRTEVADFVISTANGSNGWWHFRCITIIWILDSPFPFRLIFNSLLFGLNYSFVVFLVLKSIVYYAISFMPMQPPNKFIVLHSTISSHAHHNFVSDEINSIGNMCFEKLKMVNSKWLLQNKCRFHVCEWEQINLA